MMKLRILPLVLLSAAAAFPQKKPVKQTEVKIQKTRVTAEQEIQLGKEAAADVERQTEVLQNQEVESWLNEISQRLARTPQANAYPPQNRGANLEAVTTEFIQAIKKGDPNLQAERSNSVQLGGKPALLTRLRTRTSDAQVPDQTVLLYTVAQEAGLWNLALAAPTSQLTQAEPVFRQMAQTVQFPQ